MFYQWSLARLSTDLLQLSTAAADKHGTSETGDNLPMGMQHHGWLSSGMQVPVVWTAPREKQPGRRPSPPAEPGHNTSPKQTVAVQHLWGCSLQALPALAAHTHSWACPAPAPDGFLRVSARRKPGRGRPRMSWLHHPSRKC